MIRTDAADRLWRDMSKRRPEKANYWLDLAEQIARSQGGRVVTVRHMEAAIMAASPEFVEDGT